MRSRRSDVKNTAIQIPLQKNRIICPSCKKTFLKTNFFSHLRNICFIDSNAFVNFIFSDKPFDYLDIIRMEWILSQLCRAYF